MEARPSANQTHKTVFNLKDPDTIPVHKICLLLREQYYFPTLLAFNIVRMGDGCACNDVFSHSKGD